MRVKNVGKTDFCKPQFTAMASETKHKWCPDPEKCCYEKNYLNITCRSEEAYLDQQLSVKTLKLHFLETKRQTKILTWPVNTTSSRCSKSEINRGEAIRGMT